MMAEAGTMMTLSFILPEKREAWDRRFSETQSKSPPKHARNNEWTHPPTFFQLMREGGELILACLTSKWSKGVRNARMTKRSETGTCELALPMGMQRVCARTRVAQLLQGEIGEILVRGIFFGVAGAAAQLVTEL